MDRSSVLYAVLHYILLIGVILIVIGAIDAVVGQIDLLIGVAIAVLIGIVYPMIVRRLDLAPTQWER